MSQKFCSNCGQKMSAADKFCAACGVAIDKKADAAAKTRNTGLRDLLIIAGVLALTVAVFLIITDPPTTPEPPQAGMVFPPGHEAGIPQEMLDDAPKDYASLVDLGNKYMDENNFPFAAEMYRRALEIDGSSTDVRSDFASCLHGMGLPERALEEFRRVVTEHPEHAIGNFNMGVVFQSMQNSDSARFYWEKYLRLDPNGMAADAARQFLQETGS